MPDSTTTAAALTEQDRAILRINGRIGPAAQIDHLIAALVLAHQMQVGAAPCCEMHNEHCEPPSELCCRWCSEAAHDSFPVRHADGSRCVLDGGTDG